ncbi:MAG: DUF1684 domain-containing protein, partial [Pseudomonadota bacterium]
MPVNTMQTTLTARDGEAVAALAPDVQLVDWRRRVAHLYADIRAFNAPEAAHEHWIAHRTALADHHPQSPFKGAPAEGATDAAGSTPRRTLRHWPYDPNLRCFAHVEPLAEADMLRQDVGADGQLQMVAALITDGLAEQLGGELTLYALRGYAGGLFLPFRDTTNGTETYGGGRYLLDTIKSAD